MNKTNYFSKLARSSKQRLITDIDYWQNNLSFLISIIICFIFLIGLGYYFFPYTKAEMSSGNYEWLTIGLYSLIYLIGFVGIFLSLYVAFSTDIEQAIAAQIYRKTDDKLAEIRSGNQQMIDLEHLRSFIPDNKHFKASMIRLFTLVINEAKDRRFDSSITLMIPHREDSHSGISKVGLIQRIALQLGILGTFIGLIGAFNELNLGELKTSLDDISTALKYSFSTSIAGLIVAILLGGVLFLLGKKQEIYFQTMEQACSSLISLARNSINHDAYLSSLNTLGEAVNSNSLRTDRLNDSVQSQTSAIQTGMGQLTKTKQEFNEFINKLTEGELAFMRKMENIYNTLSPENISDQLRESLVNATKEYFSETKTKYAKLNDLTEKTVENLGVMDRQLGKQVDFLQLNQKNQKEFIDRITAHHIAEDIKVALVETSTEMLNKINSDTAALSKNISKYVETLHETNQLSEKRHKQENRILLGVGISLIGVIILGITYLKGFFSF